MQVKVLNPKGQEILIDAKLIEVDGKPLTTIFREIKQDVLELKKFKAQLEKREQELMDVWQKLR